MSTQPDDNNVLPMSPKMSVSVVMVSPEVAARWLESNTHNRPMRNVVNQYAADMAAGRWTFDAAAICFNSEGRLLNGQHRLRAVVESGQTVPFQVARNVPDEAMKTMDTGAKRSAADYFSLEGNKNTAVLASSSKLAILYTDGRIYKDRKYHFTSTSELSQFVDENEDIAKWATIGNDRRKGISAPPTVIAVAGWAIGRKAGQRDAEDFIHQLATRANLGERHPILALDSRLRTIKDNKQRVSHREYLTIFFRCWNYCREGRLEISQINLPSKNVLIPELRP